MKKLLIMSTLLLSSASNVRALDWQCQSLNAMVGPQIQAHQISPFLREIDTMNSQISELLNPYPACDILRCICEYSASKQSHDLIDYIKNPQQQIEDLQRLFRFGSDSMEDLIKLDIEVGRYISIIEVREYILPLIAEPRTTTQFQMTQDIAKQLVRIVLKCVLQNTLKNIQRFIECTPEQSEDISIDMFGFGATYKNSFPNGCDEFCRETIWPIISCFNQLEDHCFSDCFKLLTKFFVQECVNTLKYIKKYSPDIVNIDEYIKLTRELWKTVLCIPKKCDPCIAYSYYLNSPSMLTKKKSKIQEIYKKLPADYLARFKVFFSTDSSTNKIIFTWIMDGLDLSAIKWFMSDDIRSQLLNNVVHSGYSRSVTLQFIAFSNIFVDNPLELVQYLGDKHQMLCEFFSIGPIMELYNYSDVCKGFIMDRILIVLELALNNQQSRSKMRFVSNNTKAHALWKNLMDIYYDEDCVVLHLTTPVARRMLYVVNRLAPYIEKTEVSEALQDYMKYINLACYDEQIQDIEILAGAIILHSGHEVFAYYSERLITLSHIRTANPAAFVNYMTSLHYKQLVKERPSLRYNNIFDFGILSTEYSFNSDSF